MQRADEVTAAVDSIRVQTEASIAANTARNAQIVAQIEQLKAEQRSLAEEIRTDTKRLRSLTIKTDQTLLDLLASKLPEVQGFNCETNISTGAVSIQFMNCFEEQLPSIEAFLKAFIDEDNLNISIPSFNHLMERPSIIVEISSADRDRLVQGLSLAQAVPPVSSSKLTMRC